MSQSKTSTHTRANSTTVKRLDRSDLRARKHERSSFHELKRSPIVLIFDGVFGNYNQGAIFRLCDAFMVEKVYFCGAKLMPGHRRFLKAARGTHKWVPHEAGGDVKTTVESYAKRGYQIIIGEQCEGSISILEAEISSPVCIVLGGELSGVSPEILPLADHIIELPSLGMANSLNVAMTASILVMSAYKTLMLKSVQSQ